MRPKYTYISTDISHRPEGYVFEATAMRRLQSSLDLSISPPDPTCDKSAHRKIITTVDIRDGYFSDPHGTFGSRHRP